MQAPVPPARCRSPPRRRCCTEPGSVCALVNHSAPWWLPGGNLQTIWPALGARRFDSAAPAYRRERWDTPDGDFVDVDFLEGTPGRSDAPMLVLFHGLEGSSRSHYAEAFAAVARGRGWHCAVPHFRGCSGEINQAPRAYHSGDHAEVDWMLAQVAERHPGRRRIAVGVSLGGNALMVWAGQQGDAARRRVEAVCAVCSPLDLMRSEERRVGKECV